MKERNLMRVGVLATLAAVTTVLWFFFGGFAVSWLLWNLIPSSWSALAFPISWLVYFIAMSAIAHVVWFRPMRRAEKAGMTP